MRITVICLILTVVIGIIAACLSGDSVKDEFAKGNYFSFTEKRKYEEEK